MDFISAFSKAIFRWKREREREKDAYYLRRADHFKLVFTSKTQTMKSNCKSIPIRSSLVVGKDMLKAKMFIYKTRQLLSESHRKVSSLFSDAL